MDSVQSLEGARACISIFFEMLFEAKLESSDLTKQITLREADFEEIKNQLTHTRELMEAKT
jgi:hypothetical protein